MTDLDKLIEAVEAGKFAITNWRDFSEIPTGSQDTPGPILAHRAYHGSLDAAKDLHEVLLPGYGYGVGPWGARVWLFSDNPAWDGTKRHEIEMVDNPARAWLLAILKAHRSQVQP